MKKSSILYYIFCFLNGAGLDLLGYSFSTLEFWIMSFIFFGAVISFSESIE